MSKADLDEFGAEAEWSTIRVLRKFRFTRRDGEWDGYMGRVTATTGSIAVEFEIFLVQE